MLKKVLYTKLSQKSPYKPYLKMLFSSSATKIITSRLALVDSGADRTLIPYSLGKKIELPAASDNEITKAGGISGFLYTVDRACEMGLLSSDNSKIFVFNTKVAWAHPLEKELKELDGLYTIHRILRAKNAGASELKAIGEQIVNIQMKYEKNILLGRNFFKNFDFLQFIEKSRGDASKFVYRIKEENITETVKITSSSKT